jgi:hypothetical protein
LATLKAQLVLKLTQMRQRAEENAAARGATAKEGGQNADV